MCEAGLQDYIISLAASTGAEYNAGAPAGEPLLFY